VQTCIKPFLTCVPYARVIQLYITYITIIIIILSLKHKFQVESVFIVNISVKYKEIMHEALLCIHESTVAVSFTIN